MKILKTVYSKLYENVRRELEGHKRHLRLQGDRNINYKMDCE
jgi:hypothetical protein